MPVYKDEKRNTWFCKCNYKDWLGESKSKMKRGFATKKDAQQWERDFLQKQSASMDMKFSSFVEVYFEDKAPRLKERSIMTKRTLFETKIIPYFGEKMMNEITLEKIAEALGVPVDALCCIASECMKCRSFRREQMQEYRRERKEERIL